VINLILGPSKENFMWWIYPVYALLLVAMVFLSIKLADLVDLLDKKTCISAVFIGSVLLAAVTSLPELFTSISAILIVKDPQLVIGNILGSDIFNIMITSIYTIVFFTQFKKSDIHKWHLVLTLALLGMYALSMYALLAPENLQLMIGDINFISVLLLLVYIVLMVKQPKQDEVENIQETESKLTLKQIIWLFIIFGILLIGVSIAITYMTDLIKHEIAWLNGTIAGAIFLGVATSLPEVISTFHLFKLKNLNAGLGNMIGSCTFNLLILVFADVISWANIGGNSADVTARGIFISNIDSQQLIIFGAMSIAALSLALFLKAFTKVFDNKKLGLPVGVGLSLVSVASYLLVFVL